MDGFLGRGRDRLYWLVGNYVAQIDSFPKDVRLHSEFPGDLVA